MSRRPRSSGRSGSPADARERGYRVARVTARGPVHLYPPDSLVPRCGARRPPRTDLPADRGPLCQSCCRREFGLPFLPLPEPLVDVLADVGPDAADVLAGLQAAVEQAEVWVLDGGTGTVEDRLRLFEFLGTLNWAKGRLTAVTRSVEDSLAGDMPPKVPVEVDGRMFWHRVRPKRTGFDKDALRAAIARWAHRPRREPDPETGEMVEREPSTAEVVADVWVLAEPATGRTKQFAKAGIDLDEYGQTSFEDRVEAVEPNEIPPEVEG